MAHPIFRLGTIAAVLSGAALLICTTATATAAQQSPAPDDRTPAMEDQPVRDPAFNLDFKGGTLNEYVKALRSAVNGANVVVLGDGENVMMSPIKLTGVSLWQAVRVIDKMHGVSERGEYRIQTEDIHPGGGRPTVHTITVVTDARAQQSSQSSKETLILSVADLITEERTADDLASAVEAALDVFGENEEAVELRFHADTNLFISRGPKHKLEVIQRVLAEIRGAAEQRSALERELASMQTMRQQAADAESRMQAAEMSAEQARGQAAGALNRLVMIERENEDLRSLLQQREGELSELRVKLGEFMLQLQLRSEEIGQFRMEIERLRANTPGNRDRPTVQNDAPDS